eukprot:2120053-Rhodomonas_salina.1
MYIGERALSLPKEAPDTAETLGGELRGLSTRVCDEHACAVIMSVPRLTERVRCSAGEDAVSESSSQDLFALDSDCDGAPPIRSLAGRSSEDKAESDAAGFADEEERGGQGGGAAGEGLFALKQGRAPI